MTPEQVDALERLETAITDCAVAFDELRPGYMVTEWIIPVGVEPVDPDGDGPSETMVMLMRGGGMQGWKAMGLLHGGLSCIEGYVIDEEELMASTTYPNTETSANAYLRDVLSRYGLESLTGWARAELAKGYSEAVVLQHLRDHPTFRTRFKVIFDREAAGLPPMSPAEVVAYEAAADNLMRRAGLPPGFYDSKQDFHDLMLADVSINELTTRIENGWSRVSQAPQQVKDAFRDFFGADGDAALASFFLNPNVALPLLETQIAAGQLGGTARRFGVGMGLDAAMEIARTGVSQDQAEQKFEQLQSQAGLFKENISEEQDLTVDKEGVAAAFGTDAAAKQRLQKRSNERTAAFAGSGGAAVQQEGVSGLGVAGK